MVLVSCATFTPEQERSAAEVRAFADEAFRIYKVPRIPIVIGDHVQGTGGDYRGGSFTLGTRMLTSPTRDKVVAHELAHYILGHTPRFRGGPSTDLQRQMELLELDANFKGVEILTRTKPMPEQMALSMFYDHMISVHYAFVGNRTVIPFGHRPPCEEIADLLGRYPQHAAWTGSLECAKTVSASRPTITGHAPARESSSSERVVWIYFVGRAPSNGVALEKVDDLPRRVLEYDRSRNRWVTLFVAVKPATPAPVVSVTWSDESGGQRPATTTTLAGTAPESVWQTHSVPMWLLRPYPGRWTARMQVDGEAVGEYSFRLLP